MLDMGDFAGGMLKYLRNHPVPRVTVGGGFGKLTKLGQGMLDLHSGRSQVDFDWLAARVGDLGGPPDLVERSKSANTAAQVLQGARDAGLPLADLVAQRALETVRTTLRGAPVEADVVVVDRNGEVIGRAP